jgi:hypothetical protein
MMTAVTRNKLPPRFIPSAFIYRFDIHVLSLFWDVDRLVFVPIVN